MAFALAKENEAFIDRMLKLGRFNNQSEIVREALRRMEREENSYLNPKPFSNQQMKEIYRPDTKSENEERIAARTAQKSLRKLAKKVRGIEDL
jgi:putative addiction module CopG family antidote